jgi:glycine hydroxymethyltransferase
MAHHGDPVVDQKGRVIGVVTSCAVDSEGFLTGQASIEKKSRQRVHRSSSIKDLLNDQ